MIQDYPMMIYHITDVKNYKIVQNESDLKYWQENGYTKNYQSVCEKDGIEKKIDYHNSEIEKLKKLLHNDVNYKIKVKEKQIAEITSTIEPLDEPEKPKAKPQKKGRGKSRKEG